ncbi:SDR family NAD(P)-dependent oxidoreductase [Saccharopolyspora halophila]|uniref:SDR family NAD(P)-dependent oxidoreductase n=1 Tax=Saccharopolyspora halophila TaxID=405551 RepID=A0ABN3FUT2_9PSEU
MSGAVLILGGRSEIGVAVAERLARHGNGKVILAARRSGDLDAEEAAVRQAGATEVVRAEFDAAELDTHGALLRDLVTRHGPIAAAVISFGILGDQERAEADAAHAVDVVHIDYTAHVSVLTHLANLLREQGSGRIVVFSSVAGVRVRRANYVYGSAKAGLDGFANGMADALVGSGVGLSIIRPGFVIGRMTQGMSPAPWSSTPDQVADATAAAVRKGRRTVWVPGILRWVFAAMRFVPQPIWRRMPR